MKKSDQRKFLEQSMLSYISSGKNITKCPTYGSKKPKAPKEEVVEIEVDYLPQSLKARFFPEES